MPKLYWIYLYSSKDLLCIAIINIQLEHTVNLAHTFSSHFRLLNSTRMGNRMCDTRLHTRESTNTVDLIPGHSRVPGNESREG